MGAFIGGVSVGHSARAQSISSGQRVVDVLNLARSQGTVFIYNDRIVNDQLRVLHPPRGKSGVELVREVLSEHGLELLPVAENTFAIVEKSQGPRAVDDSGESRSKPALAEIIVQSSRYSIASESPGLRAALSQTEVNDLPHLGDETLRAVNQLPGTATNGWQSVGPIRGGLANETGILLDGMRLYEPFHLKNFLNPVSVLDARLIESMDVYSGAFPARFGDHMSAIIDAHTVHPFADRYYELGLSAFHANGLASFAFDEGKAHALVTARRSNLSELAQFSEHDFGRPAYADGFMRVDYSFDSSLRISANALLSRDEVDARKEGGSQLARVEYRNNYFWTRAAKEWSDQSDTQVLFGFTDITNDRFGEVTHSVSRAAAISDRRSFHIANLRVDHDLRTSFFGQPLQQRLGVEVRRLSGEYRYFSDVQFASDYPFPGSLPLHTSKQIQLNPEGDELSAYWDTRWDIGHRWAVNAGLRMDDQSEYSSDHFSQWSPRLGVLFIAPANLKLRASVGRFYQAQPIDALQVEDGETNFNRPQHADHVILSIEQEFNDLTWRVETYRKVYRGLQKRYENEFDPLSLLPEVEFDRVLVAPNRATAEGVETMLALKPAPKVEAWFNYSWSRVRDRVGGTNYYRSWDQTHAFNVGVAWKSDPWSLSVTDAYHTGWPRTDLVVIGTTQVVSGPRNEQRLGAFNSFDARITRTFQLRRGELDLFLEGTNLFDRGNECCVDYTITRGANGEIVLDRKFDRWLGRIPSLGILWRY